MNLQEVQVFFQSISSLAIAGGLIYTAVQFRNWRRAAHVANFSKLVELQMHQRELRVQDPRLAAVYEHDVEGLHSDQEIRYYFMNLMQLSIFEIVWFSHRNRQLPDDYYESWVRRMESIMAEDSFRKMMANPAMKILHDDFQKYVQEMLARTAR